MPQLRVRIRVLRILFLVGILLSLAFGFFLHTSTPAPVTTTRPLTAGPVFISFSRPQDFRGQFQNGPENVFIESIENAKCCVDLAVYSIDLPIVSRALIHAVQRGVVVRIVTDSDNDHGEAVEMLHGAKIPIVGDRRTALMHDKFIVIDHTELWIGSMNLTMNDAYRNDNNFLLIRSAELAAPFLREFDEMFTHHVFGGGPAGEAGGAISLGEGCMAQPLFAPDDSPAGEIIRRIRSARRSVHLLAFSFTSHEIANALLEAASRAVEVLGVVEESQVRSNTGAQFQTLRTAALDFRLDGNPHNMHHKVILIDEDTIVTGSYNFSESAEHNNDEDALILQCAPVLAVFEKEFQRVFGSAAP
jgi:phosphatidylserine/phosphatidylglycerophosphate/cardiolipin synthase-like enzyme